ncbi:unnamed protein product [Microthlaspi erraticum]|uniref:F-box domain-containing protein n=1 Tax=Microthlaspi erraticum TaxID=1685480 RepID=A0A6D2I0W3_9BRAS|nr:unnamed protein product [Microthlaspi erraticum]
MNREDEPPEKKKKKNPYPPSWFLSLPDVILVNCLARVPRSYYPKLCLVCKTFRSLILSTKYKLSVARFHLKTQEDVLHVCLQLPTQALPSWFSLWIRPDQTLTNHIGKKKKSTRNTLLVPTPCSYIPCVPKFIVSVGSECYGISQRNDPSSALWIRNQETNREIRLWRECPNMRVARRRAVAGVVDGKIYVMGGCEENETVNWAEVFDPKTQTWESLPDPGAEARLSSIKTVEVFGRKLYVRTRSNEKKDYVYDPRTNQWS